MAACCRASALSLYLLACFLQVFGQGEVFRQAPQAHNVFLRSKRANMFLLEEILPGNLERECYEELCNFEEAREHFEDTEKTISFWTVYYDGDQCEHHPCLHGGNCTDTIGGFQCSCAPPHFGLVCELGESGSGVQPFSSVHQSSTPESAECPMAGPTACHQLCTASRSSFACSCMSGFELQADRQSCVPKGAFPCGRLPDKFNSTASMCRHGNCPWEVSLLSKRGTELCGGVVLGRFSVLTAARCLLLDSGSSLQPSNLFVVAGNKKTLFPVEALHVHHRFQSDHHDNNLALLKLAVPLPFGPTLIHLCLPTKDFSENILMHSGRTGITGTRGSRRNPNLVYMTLDECRSQLNVFQPLSNKMFCMRTHGRTTGRQNGHQSSQGMLSGAQHQNSSSQTEDQSPAASDAGVRSEVSGRGRSGLLPGSPVATVEQGTAFLTGLLISPSAGGDGGSRGLVFTKLSRYLTWIRPRVKAADDHTTPQVSQYPDTDDLPKPLPLPLNSLKWS